ncbi:tetratricopeptide repeat protein 19 homolog, mitochondrial isoform X1 [Drosophila sulfurigaster albostrigata]|uniref:Tetratricopeptide repeat protein 19 homolog, mitochondrial isoform X1 n=1 Tax=Drosophila albomicans TaxID=7291 RepID=A0A6P8Y8A0_DROAB|nr:tetratricopeptide repeat protein 19 homolog, mitochondrial isoform X1 [Drosophila albomicans]XP_060645032.1 tetratricopeptide repeat protein 19 homolog, mitochondrial isoform X1 [Drosophila nasuta]XP_062142515.1 tetratricopeptide repeat protein 19 homolog, mitochondrial isoform X1 [Drosophila sulfurigaster albostrigata]
MLVKNFSKLTQIFGRLRYVRSPYDYSIGIHQNCRLRFDGLRSLCIIHPKEQQRQRQKSSSSSPPPSLLFTAAFSFNFLLGGSSDKDEEDTPEAKLINTIKRSILCIQNDQYDKAEQMLHLALRMAQDMQSFKGITYVYDLMANLAMEREQFRKAEKLFVDVMKRLMSDGHSEDSPKILHISSKIAHMSQLQGELEKSFQGFTWTLQRLAKLVQSMPEDNDILELYGLTKNWFGQLLMKQGKYDEARKLFKEALDILIGVYGTLNDASVTILNNISVAYVNLEQYAEARETLLQALSMAKELKDTAQEGIIQANLGLVYLREGLLKEAENFCKLAWKTGKKQENADAIEQAEYCLNEIKSCMKN